MPFAQQRIYVPDYYSDVELQVGDTTGSLLVKIEQRYGITVGRVKRQISASVCCPIVAEALGLSPGDAVLTITTEVNDANGGLIEIAYSVIDPARFNVITDVVVGP